MSNNQTDKSNEQIIDDTAFIPFKLKDHNLKHCAKCDMIKKYNEFSKCHIFSTGLSSYCRLCTKEINKKNYEPKRKKIDNIQNLDDNLKHCNKCNTNKEFHEFSNKSYYCKSCVKEMNHQCYEKKKLKKLNIV